MEENNVLRDNVPVEKVKDDVANLEAKCLCNRFTPPRKFNDTACVLASVDMGTFSIRDMNRNVMLTVSLQDAMTVIQETIDAHRGE